MIYLDYNATHPPFEDILKKNLDLYLELFANPSGISRAGQKSQRWIEQSRDRLKDLFNKEPVFCSTGTEATFLMIHSFVKKTDTVLVSPYEHEAMRAALKRSGARQIYLKAHSSGRVDIDDFKNKLESEKIDCVVMIAVSNESGVIQPYQEAAGLIQNINRNRPNRILFLSDTIQAACKLTMDYSLFDACLLNGVKIGAGPGASALLVNDRNQIKPIFSGGLQEFEKRAGTENAMAIANLADSAQKLIDNHDLFTNKTSLYQTRIEKAILNAGGSIIGEDSPRLTNTTFALFTELQNMDFSLMALDSNQFVYSTGSSCKSRTRQPAHSLLAMGYSEQQALTALRFSTGLFTTDEDITEFMKKLPSVVEAGK